MSGGGIILSMLFHTYQHIISLDNLIGAWKEFVVGKRKRKDVEEFQSHLMENVISLHSDLTRKTYRHSVYEAFNISDPKPRNIHKARVRDRLLHHGIYRILYPYFDKKFIFDSYSCRLRKGTHKSICRFIEFAKSVSFSYTKTCFVLKCDIKKFFASIDHNILKNILAKNISDNDILWLLGRVIDSFQNVVEAGSPQRGLPLGNLTSQLLVNIYMNEFDQWMKHVMKVRHYIRYADDFVILSRDKNYLLELTPKIADFLDERLKLSLHPNKVFIKTLSSGVDFLGWVHFPRHRVLRTATKKRMLRNLKQGASDATLASYKGMLLHGNTEKIRKKIEMLAKQAIVTDLDV